MVSETKTFDAAVLGSITSGTLLVRDFGKVHEAIEWLAGHPVWTHELPAVSRKLSPALLVRFPDLPTSETVGDFRECAVKLRDTYPLGIALPKGTGERTKSPISTLADAIKDIGSAVP